MRSYKHELSLFSTKFNLRTIKSYIFTGTFFIITNSGYTIHAHEHINTQSHSQTRDKQTNTNIFLHITNI